MVSHQRRRDFSVVLFKPSVVLRVVQSAGVTKLHQMHIHPPLPECLEQLGMCQPITHAFLCQKLVINDHRSQVLLDSPPTSEIGTPRRQRQETVQRRVLSMFLDLLHQN